MQKRFFAADKQFSYRSLIDIDDEHVPMWVARYIDDEDRIEKMHKDHEEHLRIFQETHNANALGKKLMPAVRFFVQMFRGKAEIERSLQQQGLEWKDIQILQNWNDAQGMVDGCTGVYDCLLDFLHKSDADADTVNLQDLILHDVIMTLTNYVCRNRTKKISLRKENLRPVSC